MVFSRRSAWAVVFALALPLAVYVYVGTFARPTVDDFCWPPPLRHDGFWALQVDSYRGSFGRWASSALISAVAYGGGALTPILPGCALALWLVACARCATQVCPSRVGALRAPFGNIVAELVVLGSLAAAPDPLQPVFWQTGLLTYMPPLLLAPVCAVLVARGRVAWAGAVALVAAGFNEPAMAMLVVAAILAACSVDGRQRRAAIGALAGAALGAALMIASPGNAIRRGTFHPAAWTLVRLEARAVAHLLWVVLATPSLWIALGLAALVGAGVALAKPRTRDWVAVAIVTIVLAAAGLAPAVYAFGDVPPRAAFPSTVAIVSGLLWMAAHAGAYARPRRAAVRVATAAAAIATTAAMLSVAVPLVRPFATYAAAWAEQDRVLREAQRTTGVAQLPRMAHNPYGLEDVGQPNSVWATHCAMEYYGLTAIHASAAR